MEIRLLRAVSLLRNPELTLGEAARQCGFNQRGLFNLCFKRRFGSGPTEWQAGALNAETHQTNSVNLEPNGRLQAEGLCPWSARPAASRG